MAEDPADRLHRELVRSIIALDAADDSLVLLGADAREVDELLEHLGATVPARFMADGVASHLARRASLLPVNDLILVTSVLTGRLLDRVEGTDVAAEGVQRLLAALADDPVLPRPLKRLCALRVALRQPEHRAAVLQALAEQPELRLPELGGRHDASSSEQEVGRLRDLHAMAHHGLAPNHAASQGWTEAEVAQGWTWEDSPSLGDAGDQLFHEDGLFTGVDRALLKTAEMVYAGMVGAPPKEAFRRTVDEFVHLSIARPSSYFLHGFTAALDPDLPAPPEGELDGDRRRWLLLGSLAGSISIGAGDEVARLCLEHRQPVTQLVAHPLRGNHIVGGVVRALMKEHAPIAAELLRARQHPFVGSWELYRDVYGWARVLVVTERAAEAEALFAALQTLPLQDLDRWTSQQRSADLLRRRVTCKRSLVDFPSAGMMLDGVDLRDLDDRSLGALHAERGLVAVRAQHLRHVTFAASEEDRGSVVDRLAPGRKHWEQALQHNPDDVRACYCLGVLEAAEGRVQRAAALLERAETGLIRDPVLSRTGLLERTRFHRAATSLQALQPGTDLAAVDALVRALDDGYRPSLPSVLDVADTLEAHQSTQTGRFVAGAVAALEASPALAALVARLLASGADGLIEVGIRLAGDAVVPARIRFDLLEALLSRVSPRRDGAAQDQVLEMVDDLLVHACDTALEERWERLLRQDEGLREALDRAEADMLRIPVLQRLGRLEDARGVATMLLYRAAQGGLPRYDPHDLLEFIIALGASSEEESRLARVLGPPPASHDLPEDAHLSDPVHIVFAGGNETQAQYQVEIEQHLSERFGPNLRITWFTPGWGRNWIVDAERIESELPSADALVILTYMRTNLGRHLRRSAAAHDVVWRSCTGQGRVSMERAIVSAVQAVAERTSR